MAITFTSGTGNLFNRLGKIILQIRNANGFRGETAISTAAAWGASGPTINDLKTATNAISAQYASTNQQLIDALYTQRDAFRQSFSSYITNLKSLASNTLIKMVDDDAALVSKDINTAMIEMIRQMVAGSKTVQANVVSASVAAQSGNTGNPTITASVIDKYGKTMEYLFPEIIQVKVTNDNGLGATAGSEPYTIKGESTIDAMDWSWPKGSSCSLSSTLVDSGSEQARNMLNKSNFDSFTANVPDKWTIVTGTAGTTVIKNTGNVYRSGTTSSLEIAGNGSELTKVTQLFNSSTGTTATLKPNSVYAVNCYIKMSAVPAAGVLALQLIDGSATVIADDASANNSITKTLSTATTSFAALSGYFRTPKALPSSASFRICLTTALDNAKSVYIDDLVMQDVTSYQTYPGGPYIAGFRGSTDVAKNDQWNITMANDEGGIFQSMFDRMFGMRSLGLILPSAASSPTQAESMCL